MILYERTEHLKETVAALKKSLWDLDKLSNLSFIISFVKAVLWNVHRKNFRDIKYSVARAMYNM